jgi:hypothetical protein
MKLEQASGGGGAPPACANRRALSCKRLKTLENDFGRCYCPLAKINGARNIFHFTKSAQRRKIAANL